MGKICGFGYDVHSKSLVDVGHVDGQAKQQVDKSLSQGDRNLFE